METGLNTFVRSIQSKIEAEGVTTGDRQRAEPCDDYIARVRKSLQGRSI